MIFPDMEFHIQRSYLGRQTEPFFIDRRCCQSQQSKRRAVFRRKDSSGVIMGRAAEGMGTLERIFRTARRIRYAKNNSTAVPGRRPIHSVRCGWALLPLLYERRRQRFSYLHFRRSAALGALRHRSGQRNLPLGRGMLLGTGML